jgi:hypothetical protein
MSFTHMSIAKLEKPRRRRRAPDEARREAVDAARALLLSGGPTAVTLSAVAAEIGVTHAISARPPACNRR